MGGCRNEFGNGADDAVGDDGKFKVWRGMSMGNVTSSGRERCNDMSNAI